MTETYMPFDAGAGANVTESGWNQMAALWLPNGVSLFADVGGSLTALQAFGDSSGMQVKLPSGSAWINGSYYNNSAQQILAIAAAHATLNRIDRVILTRDAVANTITASILQGTNASNPVPPSLTQTPGGTYQISVAQVSVPATTSTIASTLVADERPISQGIDGGTGSRVKVFDSQLGSDAATFDVQNIPQTFANIHIELFGRTSQAVFNSTLGIRFNNDSGSNYQHQDSFVSGTANPGTAYSATRAGGEAYGFLGYVPGTSTGQAAGAIGIDIPFYGSTFTNMYRYGRSYSVSTAADGSVAMQNEIVGWVSTAAINRITLFVVSGSNFKSTSRVVVWVDR